MARKIPYISLPSKVKKRCMHYWKMMDEDKELLAGTLRRDTEFCYNVDISQVSRSLKR